MPGGGGQLQSWRAAAEQPVLSSTAAAASTTRDGTTADGCRLVHQYCHRHSTADCFLDDLHSVPHHHHHCRTTCSLISSIQSFCKEPDCTSDHGTFSGRTCLTQFYCHLHLCHYHYHQHYYDTKGAAQTNLVQLCTSCLPLCQSVDCNHWSVAAIGQVIQLPPFRIIFSASVELLSSVHHHEQRIVESDSRSKNRTSRSEKNQFFSNEASGRTVSGKKTHLYWMVTLLLFLLCHPICLPVNAYTNEADQQTPNHNNGANQSPPHHRHKTGGQKQTEIGLNITRILNAFFDSGYDKRVRPDYAGPPVEVGVTMHIISISSISAVQMDFTSDLYFRQAWRDSRLSFKPRPGIEALYVGAEVSEKIWVPDTFFANEKSAQFHVATTPNTFIRIKASGEVFRSMRLTVTSNCPMNLQYFPMDRQSCTIEIESYGYSMADIQYKWGIGKDGKNDVELAKNLELPQFKVNKHRQKQKVEVLSTGNYSRLVCEIEFVRSMGYYLIQIYIPASLIVIISWVSFWLHRNASPARVQLGVTTVLTMTTLMSSTNAAMPKISYIKSIDVFLGTCFVMVFAALLEYATVGYMGKRIAMRKTRTQQILKILNDHRERCIIAAAANNEAAKENAGEGGYVGGNRNNSASGPSALLRTASLYQCLERTDPEEGHSVHKRDFRSSSTAGHACYQSSSTSFLGQATSNTRPLERSSSLKSRIFSDIDEQDPSGMNNFNDDLSVFVPARSSATDRGPQSTLPSQSPYYHYQSRNSAGDVYGRAGLSDRLYSGPSYVMKDHNTLFGVCPSDIDKYSRVVFPVCFLCFNLMYWVIYLHISEFLIDEQTSGNNPFAET